VPRSTTTEDAPSPAGAQELNLVEGPRVHLAVVSFDVIHIEVLAASVRDFVEQPTRTARWLIGPLHDAIVPSAGWRRGLIKR
jgi:hypothetical protein